MANISIDRFSPVKSLGIPFTGTLKIQAADGDFGGIGCGCDCSSGQASALLVYVGGVLSDRWACSGCACLQIGLGIPLVLVPGTYPLSAHPGALLPEETCSEGCPQRRVILDGDKESLSIDALWDSAKPAGFLETDMRRIQTNLTLAERDRDSLSTAIAGVSTELAQARRELVGASRENQSLAAKVARLEAAAAKNRKPEAPMGLSGEIAAIFAGCGDEQ